jgi:isopentenyl-diphosphate Delta-isomerase
MSTLDEPQDELIVLSDQDGNPIGSAEKWSSHHAHTPLHLGVSCYVFDARGRVLATRRSPQKKVWPGVWTNSVCGHPAPGESFVDAIQRRLEHELGMTASGIGVVLPRHVYRAPPFRGIVEYEFCPVFFARAESEPRRNPMEVADCRWMRWQDFLHAAESDTSTTFSFWCKKQLRQIRGEPFGRPRSNGARAAP